MLVDLETLAYKVGLQGLPPLLLIPDYARVLGWPR
jgi:hypothetical protein